MFSNEPFTTAHVIVLSTVTLIQPHPGLRATSALLEAAFYFYATGSLIAYMLQDEVATTDELFAAGATFTLLAWAFAYVYVACAALIPGSFTGPGEGARSWLDLLYLSVAVLSGVGLSDILPRLPMARGLVMVESFAGIMYIAIVVSRLIGMTIANVRTRR